MVPLAENPEWLKFFSFKSDFGVHKMMFCFFLIGKCLEKVYAVHSFIWFVCLFIHSFICFNATGGPLQLSLVGCDGGKNDDSSIPGNVLFYGSGSGQNNSE